MSKSSKEKQEQIHRLHAAVSCAIALAPDRSAVSNLRDAFYMHSDLDILGESGVVGLLLQSLVLTGDGDAKDEDVTGEVTDAETDSDVGANEDEDEDEDEDTDTDADAEVDVDEDLDTHVESDDGAYADAAAPRLEAIIMLFDSIATSADGCRLLDKCGIVENLTAILPRFPHHSDLMTSVLGPVNTVARKAIITISSKHTALANLLACMRKRARHERKF